MSIPLCPGRITLDSPQPPSLLFRDLLEGDFKVVLGNTSMTVSYIPCSMEVFTFFSLKSVLLQPKLAPQSHAPEAEEFLVLTLSHLQGDVKRQTPITRAQTTLVEPNVFLLQL